VEERNCHLSVLVLKATGIIARMIFLRKSRKIQWFKGWQGITSAWQGHHFYLFLHESRSNLLLFTARHNSLLSVARLTLTIGHKESAGPVPYSQPGLALPQISYGGDCSMTRNSNADLICS
jgi:hypothetical protein